MTNEKFVELEDLLGSESDEITNSVALKKSLYMRERFLELDGEVYCNGTLVPSKDIVMLLNNADDIIFSLKKTLQYIIKENVDLTRYENDDELFLYLENKGVI